MITEQQTFQLLTLGGGTIDVSVNWNASEEVSECKLIRLKIGEKEYVIKRDELYNILLMLGTEKQVKDMLPIKLTKVKRYETILEFEWKASKDIRKGEKVRVRAPHIVSIPD